MNVNIVEGKSQKTGKEYKAIEIKIGVYSARIFPTPAEIAYIEGYLKKKSDNDFVSE